jgi:hypothetical protein
MLYTIESLDRELKRVAQDAMTGVAIGQQFTQHCYLTAACGTREVLGDEINGWRLIGPV